MNPFDATLRSAITRHIADTGRGPSDEHLADTLEVSLREVAAGKERLADARGLVLRPDGLVWIAHPFSLAPTLFWVTVGDRAWWGTCAWCALGIAALVGGDVEIRTRLGGESDNITLRVRHGTVEPSDLVVHLAVPAALWWMNVQYTCATILCFHTESDVEAWCERHGIAKGAVLPVETAWRLAQGWYGSYLDTPWQRKTKAEAHALFNRLGLHGPFWDLDAEWT